MQEREDWLAGDEDWRPLTIMPSYRDLLAAIGDEKRRVNALRRLLRARVDRIVDEFYDPVYELELDERGLTRRLEERYR